MENLQSKLNIHLKTVNCPICDQEQPVIRKPKGWKEMIWGGWTCSNCGCKMDKYGKKTLSGK